MNKDHPYSGGGGPPEDYADAQSDQSSLYEDSPPMEENKSFWKRVDIWLGENWPDEGIPLRRILLVIGLVVCGIMALFNCEGGR